MLLMFRIVALGLVFVLSGLMTTMDLIDDDDQIDDRVSRSRQTPRCSGGVATSEHEFCGRHLLASYTACDPRALRDLPRLRAAILDAVEASGATILKFAEHVFPPDGMTLVVLLSESHASIHTYPEHSACFVDLFTCGLTCRAEEFDRVLRRYLRPGGVQCQIVIRDEGVKPDLTQRLV